MSLADLLKVQRAYLTKHEAMHTARLARDEQIRKELAAGIPHKQIMDATGLSRARLAQIKKGTR